MGYLFIGLIKLMGLVPFTWSQRFGGWIGKQAMKRPTRLREVAKVNIALTHPHLSAEEQDQLVRESLIETGKSGAEMGAMWGAGPDKGRDLVRKIHNEEILTNAIASGRGVLLSAPHLGNWEVMNHIATMYANVTALYRPAKNKVFDAWMRESRQKTGGLLVPTTSAGIKAMFKALEDGHLAGILPDQEPKPRSGVFAPFMGIDTLTPKLPHDLLMKTNAIAVFGFAKRLPNAEGFEVYFFEPDEEIYNQDPATSAAAMNRTIERMISIAPTQYQWTYKRFRRRPNDGENPYNKNKA